jgi:hypothetical protein
MSARWSGGSWFACHLALDTQTVTSFGCEIRTKWISNRDPNKIDVQHCIDDRYMEMNELKHNESVVVFSSQAVIFLARRQIRRYANDQCEVFFCSRLFVCVFVSGNFVFVGY